MPKKDPFAPFSTEGLPKAMVKVIDPVTGETIEITKEQYQNYGVVNDMPVSYPKFYTAMTFAKKPPEPEPPEIKLQDYNIFEAIMGKPEADKASREKTTEAYFAIEGEMVEPSKQMSQQLPLGLLNAMMESKGLKTMRPVSGEERDYYMKIIEPFYESDDEKIEAIMELYSEIKK